MIPVLTLFDDFLPGKWCDKLREEILSDGFDTELIEEAKGYAPTPYYTVNIRRDMSQMFDHIGQALGQEVLPQLQAFRLGSEKSHLHNYVHADHTCASLACVYYLNRPVDCRGGTAFWRHKKFGWDQMPTQAQLDEVGYTLEEIRKDWLDKEAWEMVTLAGMKHNRLIVYPTQAFHSRWPWEGFGDTPDNSRLIWCGFFNIA